MKIVVTGGSGQLGTLVLERLTSRRGVDRVVSLDLVPPAIPCQQIEWRVADMRDPGLERHFEGADALIHLAFIVARRASADTMRAVNVEGSKRIFEAAAQHGVRRIVYASSVAAYGVGPGQPVPVVETTPRRPSPILVYAQNKFEVEEYLDQFEVRYPDTTVVRLRPGILLGRRVAHVGEGLIKRRLMPVVGDARGPIVWDEDVADAVLLALEGEARGAYNLVASDALPGEEVARLAGFRPVHVPKGALSAASRASRALASLLGEGRIDLGWLEAGMFPLIVSPEKARKELGWKPRYPTSADVAIAFGKHARATANRRLSSFLALLPRLAKQAKETRAIPHEVLDSPVSIHVDVTGRDGADFTLVTKDGELTLKRAVARPPLSTLTLSAETFLEILSGKLTREAAIAAGRLGVKGDPVSGVVVDGLVETFRAVTSEDGARSNVARRLSTWFERSS